MVFATHRSDPAHDDDASDPDAIWKDHGVDPGDTGVVADHDDIGDTGDQGFDKEIVLSFIGTDGAPGAQSNVARRRLLGELFGEPVGSLAAEDPHVHSGRLRDTARHGNPLDQRRTAGCREEIQVTLLAHPAAAADAVARLGLLDRTNRVEVDTATLRRSGKQLTWDASVRTGPWMQRPATLRLYGSPSANITVLTLTPTTSRRWGVQRFLRTGLDAMYRLRDDLEDALTST